MVVSIISFYELIGVTLNSRDEAQLIGVKLDTHLKKGIKKIIIDCQEVIFMSRSFADEFYKLKASIFEQYGANIVLENADEQILSIMRAVSITQHNPTKIKTQYNYIKFTDIDKLYAHLLSY